MDKFIVYFLYFLICLEIFIECSIIVILVNNKFSLLKMVNMKYLFILFLLLTPATLSAQVCDTTPKQSAYIVKRSIPHSHPIKRSVHNSTVRRKGTATIPKVTCSVMKDTTPVGKLIPMDSVSSVAKPIALIPIDNTFLVSGDSLPVCQGTPVGSFGTSEWANQPRCLTKGSGVGPVMGFFVGAVAFFIGNSDDDSFDENDDPHTCKNKHHHHNH